MKSFIAPYFILQLRFISTLKEQKPTPIFVVLVLHFASKQH